jgi:hypothetical protein
MRVTGTAKSSTGIVASRRAKLSADSTKPSPGPQLPKGTPGVDPLKPNIIATAKI